MRKLLTVTALFFSMHALQGQTVLRTVEANNVRSYIASDGLFFNNFAMGEGGFEVPKTVGTQTAKSTIYSSALWVGGIDTGNTQYVSAQTYRQYGGLDMRPGPINPITRSPFTDSSFNSLWPISKADYVAAQNHTFTTNTQNWPTHFTSTLGKHKLAPFTDIDGDGQWNVINGDLPVFPGDEAVFFVYNDNHFHFESGGKPLNVEIKGFMYQVNSTNNEFLNNTTFVDYYITNYSNRLYTTMNVGVWTDFDLGDYSDDRVGTDVQRNMYYAYNGKDVDDIYGANPPATGIIFLNQPISSTIAYTNDNGPTGNPYNAQHYFNILSGLWKGGTTITDAGNGYQQGGNPTTFMYTGDPCAQTGWTEERAGIMAGDRRMLGAVTLNNVAPLSVHKITVAYLWSQGNTGSSLGSVCKLMEQADSLRDWANKRPVLGIQNTPSQHQVSVYPNPASGQLFVDAPAFTDEVKLELFDISGKKVAQTTGKTLDVSALAQGLYILRGTDGTKHFSNKVQIQ